MIKPLVMTRLCHLSAFLVLALFCSGVGAADAGGSILEAARSLKLGVERYSLDNGLRVVLNPDPTATSATVCVTYDVGARHETKGHSGLAHLSEHMMFQGTRNVPKSDHFRLIPGRGGRVGSTTTSDRTAYYQTLPPTELEIALWLEADRMKTLALTPDTFENQRAIVEEEYHARIGGTVYGIGPRRLRQLAYQGYWPYEHPVLGFKRDLDAAKLEALADFHLQHYTPGNAILSVSGRFEPARTKEWIDKYFGSLKPEKVTHVPLPDQVPKQTSERLSVVTDENAKTPGIYHGWVIPPARSKEHLALEVGAAVLAQGESSRLHQSLVVERAAVRELEAWTYRHQGPDLLVIRMLIAPLSTVDKAQEALDGELKRLRLIGPSPAELERAKNGIVMKLVRDLESSEQRAILLGHYEQAWGDASLLAQEAAAYMQITAADVRAAALKYLQPTSRSIVEVYPPRWVQDEPPEIIKRTYIVKSGDSLIGIARRYKTTLSQILQENKLRRGQTIYPGQKLRVPIRTFGPARATKGRAAKRSPGRSHSVKRGDTLGALARKYGTTIAAIRQANGLKRKSPIRIGQKLAIPAASGKRGTPKTRSYTVKRGDTLIGIAKRLGSSVEAIRRANGLKPKQAIHPGQKLTVPLKQRSVSGADKQRRSPKK